MLCGGGGELERDGEHVYIHRQWCCEHTGNVGQFGTDGGGGGA